MIQDIEQAISEEIKNLTSAQSLFLKELFNLTYHEMADCALQVIKKIIFDVSKHHERKVIRGDTWKDGEHLTLEQTLLLFKYYFKLFKLSQESETELLNLIKDALESIKDAIPEHANKHNFDENYSLPQLSADIKAQINFKIIAIGEFIRTKIKEEVIAEFIDTSGKQDDYWISKLKNEPQGDVLAKNYQFQDMEQLIRIFANKIYKARTAIKEYFNYTNFNIHQAAKTILAALKREIFRNISNFLLNEIDLAPANIQPFADISASNIYGTCKAIIERGFDKLLAGIDLREELAELKSLLYRQSVQNSPIVYAENNTQSQAMSSLQKRHTWRISDEEFKLAWQEFEEEITSPNIRTFIIRAFILALREKVFTVTCVERLGATPAEIESLNYVGYKGMGYWNNIGEGNYFKTPEEVLQKGLLPREGEAAKLGISSTNTFFAISHTIDLSWAVKFANYYPADSHWVVISVISKGLYTAANPHGRFDEEEIAVSYILPENIIGMVKIEPVAENKMTHYYITDYLSNPLFNQDSNYSYDNTYIKLKDAIGQFVELKNYEASPRIKITEIVNNSHEFEKNIPQTKNQTSSFYIRKFYKDQQESRKSNLIAFERKHEEISQNYQKKKQAIKSQFNSPLAFFAKKAHSDYRARIYQSLPLPDAPISQHARYILLHHYHPLESDSKFRANHGRMHASRAAIAASIFKHFYCLYLNSDAAKSLTPYDIKLLLIMMLFHDSGRTNDYGDDTIKSEKQSADNCYNYLTQIMGVKDSTARCMSDIIIDKDVLITQKNIFAKLFQNADCLEVLRSPIGDWNFNYRYLNCLNDIQNNSEALQVLFSLIDEFKRFQVHLADSPQNFSCLSEPNQQIQGHYDKEQKSFYEESVDCYAYIEAELKNFPLLYKFYQQGLNNFSSEENLSQEFSSIGLRR